MANTRAPRGFTIVEIAVVVAIIAFLIVAVLKGEAMLQASRVHDLIALSQDVSVAIRDFKKRYHMYPGDMAINAATPEIPGVNALCLTGGANAGSNDGMIQVIEAPCVPEALYGAGLFGKVERNPATNLAIFTTAFGAPSIVASAVSGVAVPASVQNVMLFANLPCAIALEVDSKMDDGNLATGKVQASVAACVPNGANDPVPLFAIGL